MMQEQTIIKNKIGLLKLAETASTDSRNCTRTAVRRH